MSRLLVQTITALAVSLFFVENDWHGSPTGIEILDVLLSIFWIVVITNSINFIDNLDGGAGGIVLRRSLTISAVSIMGDQLALAAISSLIAGATLGFLM